MKKMTLLAASIALALTGCGSDSGSGDGEVAAGGIIITGMDGYYQNAVVFDDVDNDGVLDTSSDKIYGLTDANGQLTLDSDVVITGALALQVIAPGGTAQSNLISYNSTTYAGIYTIDTDYPATSLSEIVLRTIAPSDDADSAVISPITDLVAIQLGDDPTDDEITAAEDDVATSLGIDATNIYSDYVTGNAADSSTHKKAQILATSKAQDKDVYEAAATIVAGKAKSLVSSMSVDEVNDVNDVPVVTYDSTTNETTAVSNSKATVISAKLSEINIALTDLNATKGESITEQTYNNISSLFSDTDVSTLAITLTYAGKTTTATATDNSITAAGITITLNSTTLTISAESMTGEDASFTLSISDIASDNSTVGTVTASFILPVATINIAPTVDTTEQSDIQDNSINDWQLTQGEAFSGDFTIYDLFEDEDDDSLTYEGTTTVEGLSVEIVDGIVTVSGTPTVSGSGYNITLTASDDEADVTTSFTLPDIVEGDTDVASTNALEGTTWYILERGTDDGDDDNYGEYSRVWCDSFLLENGNFYRNTRSIENKTECTDIDKTEVFATYEIDGEVLAVSLDGESFTMSIEGDAGDISTGAKTVLLTFTGDEYGERYTYFSSKVDAEKRINISSNDGYADREFPMYLPDETDDYVWNLGTVTVSASDVNDVDIFFDAPGEDFTCASVNDFYEDFLITSDGTYESTYSCYTLEENGVKYAGIDFDLDTPLAEDTVYSIIGRAKDSMSEYVDDIKFNVKWTGTGNNE